MRIDFNTMPINRKKNYEIDMISMFDTWKLSFSICIKNTEMPGDGGQITCDISMHPKFDISI